MADVGRDRGTTGEDFRPFSLPILRWDLAALLFLAVGPLILFSRLLVSGQTLYYRDITLDFEPQTAFVYRSLHAGHFPLWNPLSAAGYPQMAGMQPPYFYPPSILFYYLDYPQALTLYLLVHFLLAGWSAYALTRWWSWSRPSAALTGLLYLLSGVLFSLVEFYTSIPPAALLPLVVLAFDRALHRAGNRPLLAATVLFALQISTGRPDMSLMTVLFLLVYSLLLALAPISPTAGPGRILKVLAVMGVGGVFLNGIMLVPTLELLRHSTRLLGIPLVESGAHALSPFHLITLLVPDFFGHPEWGHDWGRFLLGEPYQHYSQLYLSLYPGMAAWLLAVAAWYHRRPLLVMLALLAAATLLLSLGNRTPVYGLIQALPLFQWIRHALKYFFLVNWCWVLAAGWGFEVLLHHPRRFQGLVRLGLLGILIGGILLGLLAWRHQSAVSWAAGIDFARWVRPDPTGLATSKRVNGFMGQAIPTFYWLTWLRCFQAWLTAGAMLFLISLWTAQVLRRGLFVALFLLLALGDAGSANGRLLYHTRADIFSHRPPLVDFLLGTDAGGENVGRRTPDVGREPSLFRRPIFRSSDDFRILHTPAPAAVAAANIAYLLQHDRGRSLQEKLHRQSREILDNNIALHHGLATASLYASLVPFLSPQYLWRALAMAKPAVRRGLPPHRRAVLEGMMGVQYRVTERDGGSPLSVPPGYELAWRAPLSSNPNLEVTVFRNRTFLPRAHFVPFARVEPSLGRVAFEMVRREIDYRRLVFLVDNDAIQETRLLNRKDRRRIPGSPRRCRIVASEPNRVSVLNESPESGFLVLSDIYYPGWRATVDGRERPILQANVAFRAVYVEAGRHTVEFRYDPRSFKKGAALTLSTAVVLVVFGTRRRRTSPTAAQAR